MGYMMYGLDWTYILIIIGVIISLAASARVNRTFARFAKVKSSCGMTGAEVAAQILHSAGIYDVTVTHIAGQLNDHYDPRNKTLSLSDSVYQSDSVAALGVAAHECGHAIQHNTGYAPLRIRGSLVPVVNIGSTLSWPLILLGVILSWNQTLITVGILLFSLAVAFQLITLPVELDASHRAMGRLEELGILHGAELNGAGSVLKAAALTYVAAAAASILQLLRLILLFGRRQD